MIGKDPPPWAKVALIALLTVSSRTSVAKSNSGDSDNPLLQDLAIAGLVLPDTAYGTIDDEVENVLTAEGYTDGRCHHSADGMICVVNHIDSRPDITVVLNRYEATKIYAAEKRDKRQTEREEFIRATLYQTYNTREPTDDYKDKLGILGVNIFYDMCGQFPLGYEYDNSFGIRVYYSEYGQSRTIEISANDMTGPQPAPGPVLFQHFEQVFRERIHAALPQCGS